MSFHCVHFTDDDDDDDDYDEYYYVRWEIWMLRAQCTGKTEYSY